ncbi:amino acid/amide ABC transporter membrane protein 2, haat family [Haloferax elongans ATCC BAA-1513]|uniref:Amino acid/amide ABC transporter membrane protein 2, haat family n=1 Tax=Haloferax elongans ATCC BAA-1513 TaxID=1230453 RepID=M0HB93_HALEO|nr:branched-chain amino acid ABC transporter permease [Haloferax elongans]ELZ81053.1 amino acid/amide ABC transporter membrane protein 2, haat family [Haloferax elongans ATCC BAA-1513]
MTALRSYLRRRVVLVALVAFLGAYPGLHNLLVSSPVGTELALVLPRVETMVSVFYFGLFAMSFDFVSGYTGYLSFGHAAFFGTGAYTVILVANGKIPFLASSTPFMLSLLLGAVLAVMLALLIGAVSFRLSGVYFAMITLGFAQVLYVFVRNWDYLSSNPRDGMSVLEHPAGFEVGVPGIDALNLQIASADFVGETISMGWIQLSAAEVSYYMVGLVVLACYLAMRRALRSPFGRTMVAIRENEERARAIGYDTFRYKLGAFTVSAFFAAIAGGLFAGYARSVTPENTFFFLVSGDALLAAILGGFGTLAGPLLGRLFHESLSEFLSDQAGGPHIDVGQLGLLPYLRQTLGESTLATELYNGFTVGEFVEVFVNGHESLYLGVLFVLFVFYVPNGLLGSVQDRLGGTVGSELPAAVRRLWGRYRTELPTTIRRLWGR